MEFVTAAVLQQRVTPDLPSGRSAIILETLPTAPDPEPDDLSGWSFFITYAGSRRESQRRVTLRRIDGEGDNVLAMHAFCHEERGPRHFRMDRLIEVVDIGTGEIMTPRDFEMRLSRQGSMITERRLAMMAKCLVFMARCDGHIHHSEWDQIELSVSRLCRTLLGHDISVEAHISEARSLAPDGRDFGTALGNLTRTRLPAKVHREFSRAIGDVIAADGLQHADEVRWAMEASSYIERMPTTID
ncbi:hypothetical protein ACQKE8_12865 [Sphingobium limneticum]|uniref:tellurite resistance TerB family protein n=1 Tax=Sphingobium limneticum TaxID=1007511 RepID=UPI003D082987